MEIIPPKPLLERAVTHSDTVSPGSRHRIIGAKETDTKTLVPGILDRPRSLLNTLKRLRHPPVLPNSEHDDGPSHDPLSRAISDSQHTISDQLGQLELGDTNWVTPPKSPTAETKEERRRRIKGKAHISDTPSSRDHDHRNRAATLTIREPEDANQVSPLRKSSVQDDPIPAQTVMEPKNLDTEMDLAIDFDQDVDITLTEEELALVDTMVKDSELYMDEDMLENDDLLDECPDEDAEKIDAISQLSPVKAKRSNAIKEDHRPPLDQTEKIGAAPVTDTPSLVPPPHTPQKDNLRSTPQQILI